MKILTINAGSSSIKYQLMEVLGAADKVLATGLLEKIGEEKGKVNHKSYTHGTPRVVAKECPIANHHDGLGMAVKLLTDPENGAIKDTSEVQGVGHRVVHCGEAYSNSVLITEEVIESIREHIPLGPLHNPPNLKGIEVAMEFFPHAPQVAVFDTAFHQTMPQHVYMYALPYDYYFKHRIRRYGFHGTSHKFITYATAAFIGKPVEQTSLISIHLGNGCSMAAVKNGKCYDTTMGFTPLEGLIMGTRCGDLDPAIHGYLAENLGQSVEETINVMNKKSGLKGICGYNDMREVMQKAAEGHEQAALALEMYCYRVKKYIGAYLAALGRIDAIVFTAGVGQNAVLVREMICHGLEPLGLVMDKAKNAASSNKDRAIHAEDSAIGILVIATNEELQIARETRDIVAALPSPP